MKVFKKAILVVHGFAGGVYDQEYLTHRLELIDNYDVFTFTLPGHDGNFKKKISLFNRTQIQKRFKGIQKLYKKIFV